jgi:hypothetical protein
MKILLTAVTIAAFIGLVLFAPAFFKSLAEKAHAALFGYMANHGLVLGVNTIEVYQTLARESAAIFEENAPFISKVNRAREEDFDRKYGEYKPGATVNIKVPPTATVYTGATYAAGGTVEDTIERTVALTFADATDRKHVGIDVTAFEKVFKIPEARADWIDRFLKPKIASLAATVEASMIERAMLRTPNLVGTPGTDITALSVVAAARAKLQRYLAPMDSRYALISDTTNIGLVDASKGLFNASSEISKQYIKGYLGQAQGAEFFECVNLPLQDQSADLVGAINGAAQTGAALVVDGLTAAPVAGMIFTIAGVFAVHPLTGVPYDHLQQFVTLAGSTTTSLLCYPPIKADMPNKTVSAVPADDAVITFEGTASTDFAQSLMFHRDAYTVAMMPLPVLASCEGYTYSAKGFSLRVMTFGNGQTDTESTRIDVLCTLAAPRPEWGCRMAE